MPTFAVFPRRSAIRAAALLAAVSLAAGGCATAGSGSGTVITPAPAPVTPTGPIGFPSSTAAPSGSSAPAATVAQLRTVVVRAADLPAGFTPVPRTLGAGGDIEQSEAEAGANFLQCVGGRDTDQDIVHTDLSPYFTARGVTVTSSASSYRWQSDVDSDASVFRSPSLQDCLSPYMQKSLEDQDTESVTFGTVKAKGAPHPANLPTNVVGLITATAPVEANGQELAMHAETADIVGPQVEAEVTYIAVGTSLNAAMFDRLVTAAAKRAAAL